MIRQGHITGVGARHGHRALHQGAQQGRAEGDVEDGHLDAAELLRRADLRGHRAQPGVHRPLLHAHHVARGRRGHRRHCRGSAAAARARVRAAARAPAGAGAGRRVPVAPRRGVPPVQPGHGVQAAARHAHGSVLDLQAVHAGRGRSEPAPCHAARAVPLQARRPRGPDRGGGAGRGDRQAVRHRRDVLRLDQPGGARDAGDRHEPPGRPIEHRRRRRRRRAVPADGQRRLQAQLDQAGGLGPVRRDQRVPGQRRRAADQDGAGRQAGRGRSAAGPQGLPVDREDAALDARRRA